MKLLTGVSIKYRYFLVWHWKRLCKQPWEEWQDCHLQAPVLTLQQRWQEFRWTNLRIAVFLCCPELSSEMKGFDWLTSHPWLPYRNSLTEKDSGGGWWTTEAQQNIQENVMLARGAVLFVICPDRDTHSQMHCRITTRCQPNIRCEQQDIKFTQI